MWPKSPLGPQSAMPVTAFVHLRGRTRFDQGLVGATAISLCIRVENEEGRAASAPYAPADQPSNQFLRLGRRNVNLTNLLDDSSISAELHRSMMNFFTARAQSDRSDHSGKNDSALHCSLSYAVPGLTELRSTSDLPAAPPNESLQAVRLLPVMGLPVRGASIKNRGESVAVFQPA